MSVGFPQDLYLKEFGALVTDAFDAIPYHVGSSLLKKRGWRDVDVRLILEDERYAALGLGDPEHPHSNHKWVAWTKAFSALGQQMTGLPIDFQIQQQTFANKHYSRRSNPKHQRSALFVIRRHGYCEECGAKKNQTNRIME